MRLAPVLTLAAVAAVSAGCGGSSQPAAAPAPPKPAQTAQTVARARTVSVKDFEFSPATLTVKAGTTVTWKNGDAANHTVTFSGAGAPASVDNLAQGASASRTFTRTGKFSYVCTFHPNMKATVVVSK